MKKIIFSTVFLFNIILIFNLSSASSLPKYYPNSIYIIRHANKLTSGKTGQALTPRGIALSFNFAYFYKNTLLPKAKYLNNKPFSSIYVTNPSESNSLKNMKSFREIQTVSPLITYMYANGLTPLIQDPVDSTNYKKIVSGKYIFSSLNNGENILICWDHTNIPDLIYDLVLYKGFKIGKKIGFKGNKIGWKSNDFTKVVILTFLSNGTVNIKELKQDLPTYGFASANPTTKDFKNSFGNYIGLFK